MKDIRPLIILFLCLTFGSKVSCANVWLNDLKTLYTSNNAIIYEINIRTFNANDKNGNGIIDKGEEKGNFINAIKRIDELTSAGINTVKIMPVLPVGKNHAFGTAGSLFAPIEFNKLNPQFKIGKNSVYDDMAKFVNACHRRRLRVIVDLPAFAGYDLSQKYPDLFIKDTNGNLMTPEGQDDVRVLNTGTESSINQNVFKMYSDFVNMMIDLSVDGIAVSMPETKPYTFWKKLISNAKSIDSEMLFIAETNPSIKELLPNLSLTSKEKLLEAGFDGFSGEYDKIEDLKTELVKQIKNDISTLQKFNNKKAAYTNFASYNNVSPTAQKGEDYSKQLIWLSAVMPFNICYIDGFSSGDNYMYPLSNKKATFSMTDDNYYRMKRGQIDIYNFSRKPEGTNADIYNEFVMANRFRAVTSEVLSKGNFAILKSNNSNILSFARSYNNISVIVIANSEKIKLEKIKIKVPKISNKITSIPVKVAENIPTIKKGELTTDMAPLEIQIILLQNFAIK